ncbi:hypothetical protein F5X68DRAFT_232101 [Plectosphaerella plurivora]|uniref:Uncharacterized protein n=1 Tax=Plectosphaerella plurivora TaxID=936078 RepID=A0A9P9A894_9PEZI|nr:hypothetical protein F5X68DRAFT_232101 [Plectosphaerella plurivora]
MARHHGGNPDREALRELGIVCRIGERLYIVEAKNTRTGDQHQLANNARLAEQLGWGVMKTVSFHEVEEYDGALADQKKKAGNHR